MLDPKELERLRRLPILIEGERQRCATLEGKLVEHRAALASHIAEQAALLEKHRKGTP